MRYLFFLSALSLQLVTPCFELVHDTSNLKILTPSFQDRKIAKIKLDNGLEAYIVSDPLLKESGAALSVGVGSWDDPLEYPGMAHFLEHMLFMGTKAYPDEAEYSSFIQSHGGAMNAYTASDKTVYSFSINPTYFKDTLDRFSHFFIDPLFSTSSLSRELHNVDQEHAKNVENDGSRVYQVFKDTSNKDHPNHAFSTGNAETLSPIPSSTMKEFYTKYYSAQRMHLVIMDKAPLEALVQMVKDKFCAVPVSKAKRQLPQVSIFSTAQTGGLLTIKPLRETKSLSLAWELPKEFVNDSPNMSAEFLSYLVSSEAKGQLADVLKEKGYIHSLSSSKDTFSQEQGLFSIDMDLTDLGLKQKEELINICFNYLQFLGQSVQDQKLFDQWKSILTTRFVYQDRSEVFDQVTDLAADLINQPLASFPQKGLIPEKFNSASFLALLKSFKPTNCLYILLNQDGQFDQKEPWTEAQYSLRSWPQTTLAAFNQKNTSLNFQDLQLNPYAPQTFYLTPSESTSDFYEKLVDEKNFKILFMPTNLYGLPEYCVKLKLSPAFNMEKQDLNAFMALFIGAFNKKMMFDLDAASYCGLRARLSQAEGNFWFNLEGFNDKALSLFTKLLTNFKDFSIEANDFALIKQTLTESLANTTKELGFRQGLIRFSALFDSSSSLPCEVSQALKNWDFNRFTKECQNIKHNLSLDGLIIGNATKEQASMIKDTLQNLITDSSIPDSRLQKVLDLDEQKGPYIYKKSLTVQGSSLILAIEQDKVTALTRAKTLMLMPILSEQFFDTLRTKQHTGYIAKAYDKEIAQQQFYLFGVQSNSHGALELLYRFELFIEDFINNFEVRYNKEQFESVKKSLIEEIKARKENLSTKASADMTILVYRDADFTWDEKLCVALENLSIDELKEFAFTTLPRSNRKRVAFLMEGKLPENRKLNYTPSSLEDIRLNGQFNLPILSQPKEDFDGYSKTLLYNNP